MRFVPLFLLLLAPVALAEPVRDDASGLLIDVPDGWQRDRDREAGTVKFAGLYEAGPQRYLMLTVEAVPGDGFAAAPWLANEKQRTAKILRSFTEDFTAETVEVGGQRATGYRCAGKAVDDDREYDLRLRVRGLVHDGTFFQITELSYNHAHEAKNAGQAADDLWDGIQFQGSDSDDAAGDGEDDAENPNDVVDDRGNFKITLLPGWSVVTPPSDDNDSGLRLALHKQNDDGSTVCQLEVFRVTSRSPTAFTSDTPADVLDGLAKENNLYDLHYGDGATRNLSPTYDEDKKLGDLEKSAAYEIRALRLEDVQAIREAEEKQRRGIKGIEIPNPAQTVVRGRVALLSPGIYIVRAGFARSLADNEELVADYEKLMSSWEFLDSGAKPPPLFWSDGNGNTILKLDDTRSNPEYKEEREKVVIKEHRGKKLHRLEVKFTLPPGFVLVSDTVKSGHTFRVAAQDADNNWVEITMINASAKALGETNKKFEDDDVQFDSWKSNWLAKAKRTKVPRKPQKFALGRIRGKGYKDLEGRVNKFRGTFSALRTIDKSWLTILVVETRGKGDQVFEDDLKDFLKSIKFKRLRD